MHYAYNALSMDKLSTQMQSKCTQKNCDMKIIFRKEKKYARETVGHQVSSHKSNTQPNSLRDPLYVHTHHIKDNEE